MMVNIKIKRFVMLQGIGAHAREYSSPVGVAVTDSDRSNAGDGGNNNNNNALPGDGT